MATQNPNKPVPGAHGKEDNNTVTGGLPVDQTDRKVRTELGEGTGPSTPASTEPLESMEESAAK